MRKSVKVFSEAQKRQHERWLHFGTVGGCSFAQAQMRRVIAIKTPTDEAKALATAIDAKLEELKFLLNTIRDE